MSSLLIPLPSKFSDQQFIGDLMTLFERRRVQCGSPASLEGFASELVSNTALRSDLFTLCTAISHMAAEDLSGEELLVLVARALRGTSVAKGAAVPEIPDAMRSAFLDGYKAWSNRAEFAIDQASAWPPVRKPSERTEPSHASEQVFEADGVETPAEGGRTIQHALDIVRERSANGVLAFWPSSSGPNIEGIAADLAATGTQCEVLAGRGSDHFSIRISVLGVLTLAAIFLMATGFGGAYAYHSLHPRTILTAADLNPAAPPVVHLETVAPDLPVMHSTPQPPSAPNQPLKGATAASPAKVHPPIQQRRVVSLALASNEEGRSNPDSAPPTPVAGSDVGPQADASGATAETHRALPVRVSSTIMDSYAVSAPRPVYPADLPRGISGTVLVEVSVSKQGSVTGVWAVSGPDELRPAAIQAVQAWRYKPYQVDGKPTEVTTTVGFFFNGR